MKSWDVIVIGSGAAGFAAAVTACCKGLSVLMLEKAGQFGGTSAISGGAVWLHDTDQARAEGKSGSAEAMKTYLRTIIGEGQYREDLAEAFVSAGREALAFLEREGAVKYSLRPLSPDYYPDEPGAVDVGRALEVVEYDGRELGDAFRDLRSPPPGMLLFGGMMVNRVDIQHFLDMRRSLRSLAHCTRLLLRYARDRVKYPRGTRLAMGNALIARNQRAVRFVNESSSYHHFASAMQDAAENAPCFLLCDAQAMKRYGLGLARPAPVNNDALVAAGYLHKADTLAALAQQLGLDAQTLSETVARYNRDAAQGVDREFAKGGNSYNRAMGDPGHQPDACNAPLLSAPFYAIKLYTGDLGTSRGLVTTADAQVVNTEGHPIPGLYAVGNDMDSLMAGTYPGPGITLGPGLTFGYLAACHLAQHSTH
ncbi:FAD-dependent oxidoreductase [Klebsiella pneumoniae]|uniref:FAD-dependent oxidoreductase n=1 Tax=Klebsiella pneumoniae TaxID=573 RepID=UPI0012960911|nr:FAD-dependent oxidoreductase [Klebsiella pneumoniae]QGA62726.1 FAD-dependent oxidoreductase [Klebsiella pneumoniae]